MGAGAMRDLPSPNLSRGVSFAPGACRHLMQSVWLFYSNGSRVKCPPEHCVHTPTHARLTLTATTAMERCLSAICLTDPTPHARLTLTATTAM